MADYETLRQMESTYLAAAESRVAWEGDRSLGLAKQISILAGHLADQIIPIMPIEPQPPCDDEHVAVGCRLFSDASKRKASESR